MGNVSPSKAADRKHNPLLDVEVWLAENASGLKGSDAAFVEAVYALIDDYNALRNAQSYVVLVASEGEATGDVIGPFASQADAEEWAVAQPGGEHFWRCLVRKPK